MRAEVPGDLEARDRGVLVCFPVRFINGSPEPSPSRAGFPPIVTADDPLGITSPRGCLEDTFPIRGLVMRRLCQRKP